MTVRCELIELRHADDVLFVCRHMRAMDRAEIFATRFDDSDEGLSADVMAHLGFSWIFYLDGVPVAVIGSFVLWPTHVSVWAFGTDNWPRVIFSLTRHVTRFMLPTFKECGVLMAHVYVLSAYHQARGWLKSLGLRELTEIEHFGKNGEPFVLMAWRPEVPDGLYESEQARRERRAVAG